MKADILRAQKCDITAIIQEKCSSALKVINATESHYKEMQLITTDTLLKGKFLYFYLEHLKRARTLVKGILTEEVNY